MSQIVTIIAGDQEGGAYAKAVMWVEADDITDENIAEFRTGVQAAFKASFGREAESVVVMLDDHLHDFVIPANVARVAGTDHIESARAHDTLANAAAKALESEMTVLVAVIPDQDA